MPSIRSRSETSMRSTLYATPYCRDPTRRRENQESTAHANTTDSLHKSKTHTCHLLPNGLSLSETLKMRRRARALAEKAWKERKSREEIEVRMVRIESIAGAMRAPADSDNNEYTPLQHFKLLNEEESVRISVRHSVVDAWEKIVKEHWGQSEERRYVGVRNALS